MPMQDMISRLPPVVLVIAFFALWIGEALHAARSGPRDWRRGWRNLAISALGFVVGGLGALLLLACAAMIETHPWGLFRLQLPGWLMVVSGIVLLDLADYWRHRVSHAVPLLWRLHRVHHSDPQMDVTTSLRSHPIEAALRPLFLGAAILVFGIPMLAVLVHPVVQLPVLIFQHANLRLPERVERMLAWLIATPAMHVVHHSRWMPETNSNYATFLTIWDRLFASFRPPVPPAGIGLDGSDDDFSQSIVGLLAEPWRQRDSGPRHHGVVQP
jgi:sterol desaturase/sphingolipid hydroxylase (fatty acid hydroxylase superfamily)